MIAVTTETRLEGYEIVAYKGTAQGATFADLLRHAEALEANAILNTCYDDALDLETLFHGAAVVIEPFAPRPPVRPVAGDVTEKLPAQTTMTRGMI